MFNKLTETVRTTHNLHLLLINDPPPKDFWPDFENQKKLGKTKNNQGKLRKTKKTTRKHQENQRQTKENQEKTHLNTAKRKAKFNAAKRVVSAC